MKSSIVIVRTGLRFAFALVLALGLQACNLFGLVRMVTGVPVVVASTGGVAAGGVRYQQPGVVYAQPQYAQPGVVYAQPQYGGAAHTITSGPTLYVLNDGSGRLVTRSECDGGSGCQAVIPGTPGPQVSPPVGNYRGVGSIAAVQIAPNGVATAGFIPRPN
jgi:hypothetical protein